MINKDNCCSLSPSGQFSLELSNQPNLCADHLINGHTFTRCCSLEDRYVVTLGWFVLHDFFMAPKYMFVAWAWRGAWEFCPILPIKAACQMQYVQGGNAIESVQLICHLLWVLLSPPLHWMVACDQRLEGWFDLETANLLDWVVQLKGLLLISL